MGKEKDNVNHPSHYNREGSMECIEEMELVFGREAVKSFCLCNAWKYRYRAADKNGAEDLKKSDWYMNKYKELCDADKTSLSSLTIKNTPSIIPTVTEPYPIPVYYTTKAPEVGDWPPGPQVTC